MVEGRCESSEVVLVSRVIVGLLGGCGDAVLQRSDPVRWWGRNVGCDEAVPWLENLITASTPDCISHGKYERRQALLSTRRCSLNWNQPSSDVPCPLLSTSAVALSCGVRDLPAVQREQYALA